MIIEKWKQISETLRNEFLYEIKAKEKVTNALIWGFIVFIVLFILRPFGISDSNFFQYFYTCLGYGLITFIAFLFNNFTSKSLLHNAINKKWYVWHEIIYIIIIFPQLSILNYLYYLFIDQTKLFNLIELLKMSFYTFDILIILSILRIISVLVNSFKKESIILKTKNEYYIEINKLRNILDKTKDKISLSFENEQINLQRDSIVLMNAWGNYTKIYVNVNNELVQIIKRGKFKYIEKELDKYEEFYRCHRSYIINLKYLKKIAGNNKKSEAILDFNNIKIPISRENIKITCELYNKLQNQKIKISNS